MCMRVLPHRCTCVYKKINVSVSTPCDLRGCSVKAQIFFLLSLFSGQVLGHRGSYSTGYSESGGGVGYLEGTVAIIGLIIVWKLFEGAVTLYCESQGWRKLVSPALVIGFFLVNYVSKQNETPRLLHISLLLGYICASIYLGSKLSDRNKRNRQP